MKEVLSFPSCTLVPLVIKDFRRLVQPKTYFDIDLHRYRLAIFHGGFELPGLNRFDGFLVKPQAQAAGYTNVSWLAIRSHDQPQNACALILRLASFFRVLGIRLVHNPWGADAAAYAKYSTADSATAALTYTRPSADTNTAAGT